jgi:hypothetical protein
VPFGVTTFVVDSLCMLTSDLTLTNIMHRVERGGSTCGNSICNSSKNEWSVNIVKISYKLF